MSWPGLAASKGGHDDGIGGSIRVIKFGKAILFAVCVTFPLVLLLAAQKSDWIAATVQKVVMRVFGILLSAMAVQSVFNGISGSGIFL